MVEGCGVGFTDGSNVIALRVGTNVARVGVPFGIFVVELVVIVVGSLDDEPLEIMTRTCADPIVEEVMIEM